MSRLAPALYLAGCLLVGALAGLVWRTTTPLPAWTVQDDGTVVIGEQALTRLFEATARYSLIGAVGGLVLGLLALAMLRRRGWPVVAWSVIGPLVAGLAAWASAVLGGPSAEELLAQATPGTSVPIDLALDAPVAVLVWPFLAMLPVLLWSAFAEDPDGVRPGPARAARGRSVRGADVGHARAGEPDQVRGGDLELQ